LETKYHLNKELQLHQFVSDFVTAYHGLMKVVTTPFPFPSVQMTRTFLILWVLTLRVALSYDIGQFLALLMIVKLFKSVWRKEFHFSLLMKLFRIILTAILEE
jgi:hypothetical protein